MPSRKLLRNNCQKTDTVAVAEGTGVQLCLDSRRIALSLESQRDSIIQPWVARNELPRVNVLNKSPTLKELNPTA